jgi:hypothetical protein
LETLRPEHTLNHAMSFLGSQQGAIIVDNKVKSTSNQNKPKATPGKYIDIPIRV